MRIGAGHKLGSTTAAQCYMNCERDTSPEGQAAFEQQLAQLRGKSDVWLEGISIEAAWAAMDDTEGHVCTFRNYIADNNTNEKAENGGAHDSKTSTNMGTQTFLTKAMLKIINEVSSMSAFAFHSKSLKGPNRFNMSKTTSVNIHNWPDPLAYITPTLGSRKPDVPFYGNRSNRSAINMTFLMNVKKALGTFTSGSGCSSQSFPAEALGEIRDFLLVVYEVQPYRPFLIGVLTDTRCFQFVKMVRGSASNSFPITVSRIYCGPDAIEGWQVRDCCTVALYTCHNLAVAGSVRHDGRHSGAAGLRPRDRRWGHHRRLPRVRRPQPGPYWHREAGRWHEGCGGSCEGVGK